MITSSAMADVKAADHLKGCVSMMNHADVNVLLYTIGWGGKVSLHDRLGGRVMLCDPSGG